MVRYVVAIRHKGFNSRAREGRDKFSASAGLASARFNSRAREGRDAEVKSATTPDLVSIHAPARGATIAARRAKDFLSFNSRAREGRDLLFARRMYRIFCFNSRAREGRDMSIGRSSRILVFQFTRPRGARQPLAVDAPIPQEVSIHAPARGATTRESDYFRKCAVSIHAPARGATLR